MKPEEFSALKVYGDKRVFLKMQAEGFTKVAFGKGPWIDDQRIVGGFYFFGPEGQVAGYETVKSRENGFIRRGRSLETHYDTAEFEKRKDDLKLDLSDRKELSDLLLNWE